MSRKGLELLSPAGTAETGIQAILNGADAVYIGGPTHGARKSASNSLDEIVRLVDFAHRFRAKVYATVNTIIYDSELKEVESLCRDLYHIGVDALIVQDMSILKMNIPPIALHASTQCDIRTPEKAEFLEKIGFSQLVLARELTLHEIQAITETVTIPVETFVHGALCVCYSGRCQASLAMTGRSANRGECAQICRFPFTLKDSSGKVLNKDKYLLSLKDFNVSHNLEDLIRVGVSSFKIEGRLKDQSYVKNITGLYSGRLDEIIKKNEDSYQRTSYGRVELEFNPKADKSFNRGFTNYFLKDRKPLKIASLLTPKSRGELILKKEELNNGDGISFIDKKGEFTGVNINKIEKGRIIPARNIEIPSGQIYRTMDVKWERMMTGDTAIRKIGLSVTLFNNRLEAKDDRGVEVSVPLNDEYEKALKPQDYKKVFEKLGNTIYYLKSFESHLDPQRFYRISYLTELRRRLVELLDKGNKATYPFLYRRPEVSSALFPYRNLVSQDNVSNHLAETFYKEHGVEKIEKAAEVTGSFKKGDTVMTTRHCVLRELGMCKKEKGKSENIKFPISLHYDGGQYRLDFDCKNCEMQLKLQ